MTLRIVIAPLSDDPLRDWPMESFCRVADLCVERLGAVVDFVGTRQQRVIVSQYLRARSPGHYINQCGRHDRTGTSTLLRTAFCVIANDSGLGHLAASLGVPTVCVFCASHSPLEWMPRGPRVAVLTTRPACAPCAINRISDCPYGRRCFVGIDPQFVFRQVVAMCQPAGMQEPEANEAQLSTEGYTPPWLSHRRIRPAR